MKQKLNILIAIILGVFAACQPFETPLPELSDFNLYELSFDENGDPVKGNEITNPKAGEQVRIEMLTDADIVVIWPGDVAYHPWGANDSILVSRNYEHIGQPGAQGLTTTVIEGWIGYYLDFTWPEAGDYPVTVVLTNHGVDGPGFKQRIFDFDVIVVE